MPSSMHNVIVLAHVIILSFMCACCKANLIIIIITCALSRDTKYWTIDSQVCFYRRLFIDAVKPRGFISWPWGASIGLHGVPGCSSRQSWPPLCIVTVKGSPTTLKSRTPPSRNPYKYFEIQKSEILINALFQLSIYSHATRTLNGINRKVWCRCKF